MLFHTDTNASRPSLKDLPPYSEYPRDIELANIQPTDSTTSLEDTSQESSPSQAGPSSSPARFKPTVQLQLQAGGKAVISLPGPVKAVPIPVFSLTADGHLHRPLYLSIRPGRRSGSCSLVLGDDETETPLTTTTYHFGPGRPPRVRLAHPADPEREDEFEVTSPKMLSRSQVMQTSFGTFAWRYAGSGERAAEAADSLLVLERITITGEGKAGREQRTRVAQLVRNEVYRTPGSTRSSAGNGGRLMLDLSGFDEKSTESVQLLAVTTVLVMLKKEVDRRRMLQAATISAACS